MTRLGMPVVVAARRSETELLLEPSREEPCVAREEAADIVADAAAGIMDDGEATAKREAEIVAFLMALLIITSCDMVLAAAAAAAGSMYDIIEGEAINAWNWDDSCEYVGRKNGKESMCEYSNASRQCVFP